MRFIHECGGTRALRMFCPATLQQEQQMTDHFVTDGTNRDFACTRLTRHPDRIWELWTTPDSWHMWDLGLRSAEMEAPMAQGSTGRLFPVSGPASRFQVTVFEPRDRYAFVTALPFANLTVARFFSEDRSSFTHRVSFSGPLAGLFAWHFGPRFRAALPPTLQRLVALSEDGA